jgi:DNA-binding NarL/FixJ family response regulator
VVATVSDADALLGGVRADPPEAVVVDKRMPPTHRTEGLEAARRIRAEHPEVGVLVLSQYVEPHHALQLLEESACGVGYLLKDRIADGREVADALRRVAPGGTVVDTEVVAQLFGRRRSRNLLDGLTKREHQVLALMAEGRTNSAISECLYLSPKTVEASSPGSISTRAPTTTAGSSPSSRSCGAVRLFSRVGRCSGPGRAARR